MAKGKIEKAVNDAITQPMDADLKANLITGGILIAATGAVKAYEYFKDKRNKKKKKVTVAL